MGIFFVNFALWDKADNWTFYLLVFQLSLHSYLQILTRSWGGIMGKIMIPSLHKKWKNQTLFVKFWYQNSFWKWGDFPTFSLIEFLFQETMIRLSEYEGTSFRPIWWKRETKIAIVRQYFMWHVTRQFLEKAKNLFLGMV